MESWRGLYGDDSQVTREPVAVPAAAPSADLTPAATSPSTSALLEEARRNPDVAKNYFAPLKEKSARSVSVVMFLHHWLISKRMCF